MKEEALFQRPLGGAGSPKARLRGSELPIEATAETAGSPKARLRGLEPPNEAKAETDVI